MAHAVKDRSSHTAQAIRKRAVVVLGVPKVKDQENDQKGHEDSHLISDLQRAARWPRSAYWMASEMRPPE